MNGIATFFTIYWIIYFPTCIAFNDLPGFRNVDEVMTALLIVYTFYQRKNPDTNQEPWKEYFTFIGIIGFYIVYSLMMKVNVRGAVWVEFVQQIRPYSIIYCTWILNPQFTKTQKKWMLGTMIVTLASWIYFHPETTQSGANAEFPVLGQLAICTGMAYYLFTQETKQNQYIALAIVFTGLLAPKFKFMGEVVCFIALIFFVKKQLDFKSPTTAISIALMMAIVIVVVWQKFDVYYVSGWNNSALARPMTYKTSLQILWDYFPFGSGMGTFASWGSAEYYSPLYYKYGLSHIWGLQPHFNVFIADAFYPTLSQYGIVGVVLFFIFWKRRLTAFNEIEDMRYYRIAMLTFFCLAIEQTADTSWLSGKGMGYCMLIGLCLNANRNLRYENEDENENEEAHTEITDNTEILFNENERPAEIADRAEN